MPELNKKSGKVASDCILFWRELVSEVAKYMHPGDYISHKAAAFLHGITSESPLLISVISQKRHRNRVLNGIEIRFVYRKDLDKRLNSHICHMFSGIAVAKPLLAWLDMLNDLDFAFEMDKLAEMAQTLAGTACHILGLAGLFSDSVVKRAAFYLAWSGRLQSYSKFADELSDSAVKLDHRTANDELLWEKPLKVFFPARILELKPTHYAGRNKEWLIFRNSPGYISALRKQKSLILINDNPEENALCNLIVSSSPVHYHDFSSWLADMGLKISDRDFQENEIKNIGKWLKPFAGSTGQKAILLEAYRAFSSQIQNDADTCCGAMIVALATNSHELVEYAAYNWGEFLFFHGKSGLLALAYRMLGDYNYGHKLRAVMATALVVRGLIAEAVKLWSTAEKVSVEQWGWTCLAEAATAYRSGKKEQAKAYYQKAIEAFSGEKNQRMATVSRLYLGIVYLGENDYEKSRQLYVEILKCQTQKSLLSDNFLGVLHGNLGIIEFRQAAFKKAAANLELGARLSQKVANQTAHIMILFYLALTEFYLGKFVSAYHIAQEAWSIKQKTASTFMRSEHPAQLASFAQYLGRFEESDYWISKLANKNSSEEVVINLAKARGLLFRHKISEAVNLLLHTRKYFDNTVNPIIVNRAFVLLALLSNDHAKPYISPARLTGFEKGTAEHLYSELISQLLEAPSNPDKSKLEQIFHNFNSCKTFDPMWFLVFAKVADLRLYNAQKYFIWQYAYSSSFIRAFARKFFKDSDYATGLIEKMPADAEGECISLGEDKIELITRREYNQITENEKASHPFFFDGISGKIYIFSNRMSLKSNSMQARLLSFMLQSHSRRVLLKLAYEFVWRSKYSEFDDDAVVKTTVARINKLISKHSATHLIRIVSIQLTNYLEIQLPDQWHAFLPCN